MCVSRMLRRSETDTCRSAKSSSSRAFSRSRSVIWVFSWKRVALKNEATDFIGIKSHPKGLFYGDILESLDIKFYRCQISNEIGKYEKLTLTASALKRSSLFAKVSFWDCKVLSIRDNWLAFEGVTLDESTFCSSLVNLSIWMSWAFWVKSSISISSRFLSHSSMWMPRRKSFDSSIASILFWLKTL